MANTEEILDAATAARSATTAEIMRRFNHAFLQHDPAALAGLVAEDCVIENTTPAPNGARHVGRDACLALWQGIATAPGTRFDLEEVVSPANGRPSAGATGGVSRKPTRFAASI